MAWDLKLDPATRDLAFGIVTGPEEVLQRLVTRLNRELGEWFLNTSAGLPWYQSGEGLLGSRNKQVLDLLIRRETTSTDGVDRILQMRTTYLGRDYGIFMQLLLAENITVELSITEEGTSWQRV